MPDHALKAEPVMQRKQTKKSTLYNASDKTERDHSPRVWTDADSLITAMLSATFTPSVCWCADMLDGDEPHAAFTEEWYSICCIGRRGRPSNRATTRRRPTLVWVCVCCLAAGTITAVLDPTLPGQACAAAAAASWPLPATHCEPAAINSLTSESPTRWPSFFLVLFGNLHPTAGELLSEDLPSISGLASFCCLIKKQLFSTEIPSDNNSFCQQK